MAIARPWSTTPTRLLPPLTASGHAVHAAPLRRGRARGDRRAQAAAKILTYDDLLLRLRDTLADPERGPAACARLRERYEVVLVDEFQDTDPVQWEIVRARVRRGATTLVLIGDPKQAIYAFRGADVHAYLMAPRRRARNRRSTSTGAATRHCSRPSTPSSPARSSATRASSTGPSAAAAANQRRASSARPSRRPLRIRIVHAADGLVPLTPKQGLLSKAGPERHRHATWPPTSSGCSPARPSSSRGGATARLERVDVHPGDIAVLVRPTPTPRRARGAARAGVPAVIGGAGLGLRHRAGQEWLRLLEALERPTPRDRAALAALTRSSAGPPTRWRRHDEEWEDLHWPCTGGPRCCARAWRRCSRR